LYGRNRKEKGLDKTGRGDAKEIGKDMATQMKPPYGVLIRDENGKIIGTKVVYDSSSHSTLP